MMEVGSGPAEGREAGSSIGTAQTRGVGRYFDSISLPLPRLASCAPELERGHGLGVLLGCSHTQHNPWAQLCFLWTEGSQAVDTRGVSAVASEPGLWLQDLGKPLSSGETHTHTLS